MSHLVGVELKFDRTEVRVHKKAKIIATLEHERAGSAFKLILHINTADRSVPVHFRALLPDSAPLVSQLTEIQVLSGDCDDFMFFFRHAGIQFEGISSSADLRRTFRSYWVNDFEFTKPSTVDSLGHMTKAYEVLH